MTTNNLRTIWQMDQERRARSLLPGTRNRQPASPPIVSFYMELSDDGDDSGLGDDDDNNKNMDIEDTGGNGDAGTIWPEGARGQEEEDEEDIETMETMSCLALANDSGDRGDESSLSMVR